MVDFSGFHVGKEFLSPNGSDRGITTLSELFQFPRGLEDDWLPGKPRIRTFFFRQRAGWF